MPSIPIIKNAPELIEPLLELRPQATVALRLGTTRQTLIGWLDHTRMMQSSRAPRIKQAYEDLNEEIGPYITLTMPVIQFGELVVEKNIGRHIEQWLSTALEDRPQPVRDLMATASTFEYNHRTVKEVAKNRVRVISIRLGYGPGSRVYWDRLDKHSEAKMWVTELIEKYGKKGSLPVYDILARATSTERNLQRIRLALKEVLGKTVRDDQIARIPSDLKSMKG